MGSYPSASSLALTTITDKLTAGGYLSDRQAYSHLWTHLYVNKDRLSHVAAMSGAQHQPVSGIIIDATGDDGASPRRPSSAHGRRKKSKPAQPRRPKSACGARDLYREGVQGGYEALAERLKSALAGATAVPASVAHYAPPIVSTTPGEGRQRGAVGTMWEVDMSDFSSVPKRPSSAPSRGQRRGGQIPHGRSQDEYIPPRNTATPQSMAQWKVMDMHRWFCLSRPQYKTSCGLSSLVSCWNYLFSTLGRGTVAPITQEEALVVLGFSQPFNAIKFGSFTGNKTLMRWFLELNRHYNVRGRAFLLYKPQGKNRTVGVSAEQALSQLKEGLQSDDVAFIYHCQNHYFCPMGYEDVPLHAVDAYRAPPDDETETWILIGDPSRKHPGIHCKKWTDIVADLNTQNPEYLDIRRLYRGLQTRKTKKVGGNLHCLMAFKRSKWQGARPGPPRPAYSPRRAATGAAAAAAQAPREAHIPDNYGGYRDGAQADEFSEVSCLEESDSESFEDEDC